MLEFYLLWIGIGVVLLGYFIILVIWFKYKNDICDSINGFDMAKEITSDYENINIVLAPNQLFSKYHVGRKVLRLTEKDYSGNNIFSLSVVTYLSGLSMVRHKFLMFIGNIIPSISFGFYQFIFIIYSFISYFFNSKGDAKIGMVIGLIILVYEYFYLQVFSMGISCGIDRVDVCKDKIKNVLLMINKCHVMFFVSGLIFMLRFMIIIMK